MENSVACKLRPVQDVTIPHRGGIVNGAAQIAKFVWNHVRGERDSFWFVEMDADRRLLISEPVLLREKPIAMKGGNVGNGLMTSVRARAEKIADSGCYAVVHFCRDAPKCVDIRDRVTAERLRKKMFGCYLPKFLLTSEGEQYLNWARFVFFVDMIQLWRDGSYISFREGGVVPMDGGEVI